jgi:hypothetical protein
MPTASSAIFRSIALHVVNPTIRNLILSDWSPHIENTVRAICIPIAAAYVAGYMVGQWLHQLNDALTLLVAPRPHNPAAAFIDALEDPGPIPLKVQRYACAPVVARCGIQAPDPMAKAVAAVMGGSSQAAAARRYGVSRSTLRRRLKGS